MRREMEEKCRLHLGLERVQTAATSSENCDGDNARLAGAGHHDVSARISHNCNAAHAGDVFVVHSDTL